MGTTDFQKIAPWIALWMLIFNTSRYKWDGNGLHSPVFPGDDREISEQEAGDEDIFHLLRREGIFPGPDLSRMLWKRRRELQLAWAKVLPQRVASWSAAGWYEENSAVSPTVVLPLPSIAGC